MTNLKNTFHNYFDIVVDQYIGNYALRVFHA